MIIHRNTARGIWYYRYKNMRPIFIAIVIIIGISGTAHAQVYFMGADGSARGTLNIADDGANKGRVVVDVNGKETLLGGGGNCGILCTVLTAKIEDGKARIVPLVPDVYVGDSAMRFKAIFAETFNAKEYELVLATPELATAAVGKMIGITGASGVNAKIGLVNTKDERVDVLITEMNQAKTDIAFLKTQLALVKKELAMKVKETLSCRSESIPVIIEEVVGSGDWVVSPVTVSPRSLPAPMPEIPSIM